MAGTLFQDARLPLTSWFRAMRLVVNQKYGANATGLKKCLA
jgi:hypothetical protein